MQSFFFFLSLNSFHIIVYFIPVSVNSGAFLSKENKTFYISQKNFFLSALLLGLIRCWQDALNALGQGAGCGGGGACRRLHPCLYTCHVP